MLKSKISAYFFVSLFFVILLSSCVSEKKIVYFQNGTIDQTNISNAYQTVFKSGDLLKITVTALDSDAVKPFNLAIVNVDNKGFIDFSIIGKIKLGGLTRAAAIRLLKSKLSPDYVKNPTINIRITNFTITVLGAVQKPGNYTIPNERITILQVLGLAGDLKISGKRNKVLVQREVGNKKIRYYLDLRSNAIFTSPAYYLQQNDLVYVEPNRSRLQDSSYNKYTGLFVSITSILVSLVAIFAK